MISIKYPHIATLWRTAPDGYGGFVFAAPLQINCRWVEKQELVPGSSTEISKSVIYTEIDVDINDFLVLGAYTDASPIGLPGNVNVRMFSKIPDLRNLGANRKCWVT